MITAAQANTVFQALRDARSAANQGHTNAVALKGTRDTAVKALRKRMCGLVDERTSCSMRMTRAGMRLASRRQARPPRRRCRAGWCWPGGGPSTVDADWSEAARTEYYRVWKQVVSVDAEFVAVGSPMDSDLSLTDLPSGAAVKVEITSVNGAGKSSPAPRSRWWCYRRRLAG